MNNLHLFLPCAGGVETYLAAEAAKIIGDAESVRQEMGGVAVKASWRQALELNLHSRLASRVLVGVMQRPYRSEDDIYEAACDVAWEIWFTPKQTFKIDITATRSPLKSLNFAALRVKDAICDRFRHKTGERPSVDTQRPEVRVYVHLSAEHVSLYVDTSGEPLFKRGWRQDKGDAPLKETLAAAMIAASGWQPDQPLYDPCCGSGTIAIEAAQIALGIPAGGQRRFGFERLLPFQKHVWDAMKSEALRAVSMPAVGQNTLEIYGSDVAHRMVDFAQRNADLAGVGELVQLRGGDALQRKPPCDVPPQGAVILTNPPYGERIEVAGVAGTGGRASPRVHTVRSDHSPRGLRDEFDRPMESPPMSAGTRPARETAEFNQDEGDFFPQLATHWKTHFDGWTAHLLVPDMKLPGKMRLKETRRVPLWNGPIECRLFRFDIQGRRATPSEPSSASA
ncbi:THUMP domain-containing protein [Variovorax sp. PCZ-1]|uniref:THUMP domain-containing class I SAM-dependent RNA methyltransferase n=1 Tax=Variovorax sp. PCZ-1 TaxID=2835533 RepID=UPI001BD15218|nr:THUMP domain-containing protein [Variovorax sp. PCZ-1]MBS7806050.1 N-6 DNA methylase [Variovorax sp. PCZ-1]